MQSLVRELEYRLKEKGERLEGYEQLETELDDVVLQAAKSKNERRGRDGREETETGGYQTDKCYIS